MTNAPQFTKFTLSADEIEAIQKMREEMKAHQIELRDNPAQLAAEIAEKIRNDDKAGKHPRENPEDSNGDYFDDGRMHWLQDQWGYFRANRGSFVKLDQPVIKYGETLQPDHHEYFEVTCPTTGCIAGWATSLAGFPFVFKDSYGYSEAEKSNVEDGVLDHLGEDELISVESCFDPTAQTVRMISDAAGRLLDLNHDQREYLFHGDRTKDEVLEALDKIADNNSDWPSGGNYHEDCEDCERYNRDDDDE